MYDLIAVKHFSSVYNICVISQPLFFIFREIFILFTTILSFFLYFLWIGFDIFHAPFLKPFFVRLVIFSTDIYIYEKNFMKKIILKNVIFQKITKSCRTFSLFSFFNILKNFYLKFNIFMNYLKLLGNI